MPQTAWDSLACPHCAQPLSVRDGGLRCPRAHHFDLARHGYVSLLGGRSRTDTADTAAMVAARAAFLAAELYRPIADAVAAAVAAQRPRVVAEVGAGTGYYLAAALAAVEAADPERPAVGVALDASKFAARSAARAHPGVLSVVADAWEVLPLGDRSVDTVLSVFAPRQVEQILRVLRPTGALVVVTPESGHLAELIEPFGMLTVDDGKADRLEQGLAPHLRPVGRERVRAVVHPTSAQLTDLVMMGPSAWHVDEAAVAGKAAAWGERPVTIDVTVSTFVKPAGRPLGRLAVRRPG
ncbi:methyltransferase domain-containing protein [Nakamurella silvestris]|nr:methyltransferase domain-containing protein [Nakamurella silvestris]